MAQDVWVGGTTAIAQVDTYTPANVGIADIFTLTVTGEDGSTTAINFTATAATVANVTAGLTAAWNASTHPLCTPITATDLTTVLKLTADTAGVPFYVASTTTDGNASNTQTLTRAATTANSGPKDWNTVLNWSTGAKPVASDDVTFDGRASNEILYGLDQSAITLASLSIKDSFGYSVGQTGAKFKVSSTTVTIGEPASDGSTGSGSALINLDLGSAATTVRVVKTRQGGTSGYPPVQIKAVNASNKLTVDQGVVGVSTAVPGEASTFTSIDLLGQGHIDLGSGVTLTTLNQTAGDIYTKSGFTTLNQDAGTLRTEGAGAVTTANVAGTYTSNSTGTITTLNIHGNGTADFTDSTAARTVTNCTMRGPSCRLLLNSGKALAVTFTNGVQLSQAATSTQVDTGDDTKLTFS